VIHLGSATHVAAAFTEGSLAPLYSKEPCVLLIITHGYNTVTKQHCTVTVTVTVTDPGRRVWLSVESSPQQTGTRQIEGRAGTRVEDIVSLVQASRREW